MKFSLITPTVLKVIYRLKKISQRYFVPPGTALKKIYCYMHQSVSHDLVYYQNELLEDTFLREQYFLIQSKGYISKKYPTWGHRFGNLFSCGANISWFYALIRELKPKRIIETGTAAGSMTSLILAALYKNNEGELVSIDLPAQKGKNTMDWSLPTGEKAGFLIPEIYKARWELRTGDAKDLLVSALRERNCDIFFHDSLHTYEHMMWEYITAFVNMKQSGIIISDDILWNKAWWDFTSNFDLPRICDLSNPNIGITVIR